MNQLNSRTQNPSLSQDEGDTVLLQVENFDLKKTLESGQCFRWRKESDGSYTGVVNSRIINARQIHEKLLLFPATEADVRTLWIPYFDLDSDYSKMNRSIRNIAPWMSDPLNTGSGIRILKQDPWEITITFILSANNNIARISGSVARLAERYGPFLGTFQSRSYYGFPSVEILQKLEINDWKALGAGYRAGYLHQAVARWEHFRREIEVLDEHDRDVSGWKIRSLLEELPGVGPKVSACISLFGWGYLHQFPVDVWISRILPRLWPQAPGSNREMEEAAVDLFGDMAGYAQQLLFYYARHKKDAVISTE